MTGSGDPQHVIRRVPRINDAGQPVMTPGGKPSVVEVKTEDHLFVDTVRVKACGPGVIVAAHWIDSKWDSATIMGGDPHFFDKVAPFKAWINAQSAPSLY